MNLKISWAAVYVMWLREMKRFFRAHSRVIGTLVMPVFILFFFGKGFSTMVLAGGVNYTQFLVPGIVGMTMHLSSMFAGISVMWDREFGFLKEIMVAPVSRLSIVLGRIVGGSTTSIFQGLMILVAATLVGFLPKASSLIPAVGFMLLISFTFIGVGLTIASNMRDVHGFNLILNFIMFPLLFLSGAFYPIENLPQGIQFLAYADPLFYGVDGLRAVLIGTSTLNPLYDAAALVGFSLVMVTIGAIMFEKSEVL